MIKSHLVIHLVSGRDMSVPSQRDRSVPDAPTFLQDLPQPLGRQDLWGVAEKGSQVVRLEVLRWDTGLGEAEGSRVPCCTGVGRPWSWGGPR